MNKRMKKKHSSTPFRSIRKIQLKENDIVVIQCNAHLQNSVVEQIHAGLKTFFPNNKCLILQKDFDLKIISQEQGL